MSQNTVYGADVIKQFHETHTGKTTQALMEWRTQDGFSSYEVLAHFAGKHIKTPILDLACGDGYLLELLQRKGFSDLTGVDSSADELEAARARLGTQCVLRCDRAHATTLPARHFDLVVCHMALMLFEPLEPVLEELGRILKPGARFIAVVNRPFKDPAMNRFVRQLTRLEAELDLEPLSIGDLRVYNPESLATMLDDYPFERFHHEDFHIEIKSDPDQIWNSLSQNYPVFRLPDTAQRELRQCTLEDWQTLMNGSTLQCAMGMRLLTFSRAV